jgi:hypothetical protein
MVVCFRKFNIFYSYPDKNWLQFWVITIYLSILFSARDAEFSETDCLSRHLLRVTEGKKFVTWDIQLANRKSNSGLPEPKTGVSTAKQRLSVWNDRIPSITYQPITKSPITECEDQHRMTLDCACSRHCETKSVISLLYLSRKQFLCTSVTTLLNNKKTWNSIYYNYKTIVNHIKGLQIMYII